MKMNLKKNEFKIQSFVYMEDYKEIKKKQQEFNS